MAQARAVIFDLDGTLIDSIELIVRSYEHAVLEHGLPSPGRSEWLRWLGTPLKHQFSLLVGECEDQEARVEALIRTYRAWNLAHHDELVKPYRGVTEAVARLAADGRILGIVTSKMRASAQRGMLHVGLEPQWFQAVVGLEDTARHKPDPAPLLLALEQLGVAPEQAIYVGDSPHDAACAQAAGATAMAVRWGPFQHEHFAHLAPVRWLEDPAELCEL
jgi:pyrophosphatase PpaX